MLTALAILVACRTFVVGFYTVASRSMAPTLLPGDWVAVNKVKYGARMPFVTWHLPGYSAPGRGDVAVFVSPELVGGGPSPTVLIKRVVGIAGDTLLMRDGVLGRNAPPDTNMAAAATQNPLPVTERQFWWIRAQGKQGTRFGPPPQNPTIADWGPIVVPIDSLFMMGDNVYGSEDSRQFGFIGINSVIGAASAVYLSVTYDDNGRSISLSRNGFIRR